jgi:hypothetical protein
MAFDNVTLFEINIQDFPFGGETGETAETEESVEIADEPSTESESEASSGSRARRVVGFLFGAVILAAVARWAAQRRGSDEDEAFETEEIEPGVERVDA